MKLLLPPDMDNKFEMQMVVQIVAAVGRSDPGTFLLILLLVGVYVFARIFMATFDYLFDLALGRVW